MTLEPPYSQQPATAPLISYELYNASLCYDVCLQIAVFQMEILELTFP